MAIENVGSADDVRIILQHVNPKNENERVQWILDLQASVKRLELRAETKTKQKMIQSKINALLKLKFEKLIARSATGAVYIMPA